MSSCRLCEPPYPTPCVGGPPVPVLLGAGTWPVGFPNGLGALARRTRRGERTPPLVVLCRVVTTTAPTF